MHRKSKISRKIVMIFNIIRYLITFFHINNTGPSYNSAADHRPEVVQVVRAGGGGRPATGSASQLCC